MKTETLSRQLAFLPLSVLALLLAACATPTSTPSADQSRATETAQIEPWDGDGMEIPLDGTSLAAFERSLARVKAYTSPDNYATLVNAIDYLLVYDLRAKRDRAKLAADLNGLTGNQVLERVNWAKPDVGPGQTGKSAASDGTADV